MFAKGQMWYSRFHKSHIVVTGRERALTILILRLSSCSELRAGTNRFYLALNLFIMAFYVLAFGFPIKPCVNSFLVPGDTFVIFVWLELIGSEQETPQVFH